MRAASQATQVMLDTQEKEIFLASLRTKGMTIGVKEDVCEVVV